MISTTYNPDLPLRYLTYGRMSSEEQNPRSPEQQFDDIDRTKKKQRRDNWGHVKTYRDDGISGRYYRKRPGFRRMLDEIRSGMVKVDAILVDTIERFARLDDLPAIRDELRKKYGVLVLTSDTGFADPNLVGGGTCRGSLSPSAGGQTVLREVGCGVRRHAADGQGGRQALPCHPPGCV